VTTRDAAVLATLLSAAALAAGCHRDGCVGGDDGSCVPPSACSALHYECGSAPGTLRVTQLTADVLAPIPMRDAKARAAEGDIMIENDLVRVVLDAPSHPSALAPTGGTILDFAPVASDAGDQINSIYQAAGLLPRDAVHYDSYHIDEHIGQDGAGAYVAVVFRGRLEGDSRVTVVTRYELRACEPGIRVRSDLYNGAPDPNTLYLADGLFWGDNSAAPFVPGVGLGFRAPELDLMDVASAWREWPFVAARTQATPAASYAVVPCDHGQGAGFNDPTLTASGVPLVTTPPGDGIHLERFITATAGPGLAPAVGEALRVRAMVHGEPAPVTVAGRVVAGGVPIDGREGRAASLLFYEPAFGPDPDDPSRRKPWTEAVPGTNGRFSVALPPDRAYRVQPYAFGLAAANPTSFLVAREDADIGDITLKAAALLKATVVTAPGQSTPDPKTYAELVIVPAMPPPGAPIPSFYGLFPGCNPMLGPPHGGSPACNRAITRDGTFNLLIPDGHYFVYATRGPFATVDHGEITISPGSETTLPFVVESLPLLPAGVVSGDFHVHGAASYDSSIPDQDRVVSFVTSGVDVVVATDHDVVTTYKSTLDALGIPGRITVIPGVEQTPNIPWFAVPGEDLPKTLGHFNFWPLTADASHTAQPRNGAPWDELREPGQMMDDIEALFDPRVGAGIRQLNHPYSESKLGRDQGFLRVIGYDPRTPIEPGASFAADMLLRVPNPMGVRRNLDWDVQEVMTGASPANWLRYRTLWFSLLSQGILRAGTANSDTHTLALEQIGYPRNLVWGGHSAGALDVGKFDQDVLAGHMVGTTGPVIEATIENTPTDKTGPGLQPFHVLPSAQLVVKVSTAPWIPVEQVRVIVNGSVVRTWDVSHDLVSSDPHGTQVLKTAMMSYALDTMALGGGRDLWVVVEAGFELADEIPDIDGDGLPDLPDMTPGSELAVYQAIVPGAWPIAFTNPFLLDVNGDGVWEAPGLP